MVRWSGDDRALDLARTLEAESSHHVARAFQHAGRTALHAVRTVDQVVETPGLGISGRLDGHAGASAAACMPLGPTPSCPPESGDSGGGNGSLTASARCSYQWTALSRSRRIGDKLRADAHATVVTVSAPAVSACSHHLWRSPDVVSRIGAELGLAPKMRAAV